MRHAGPGVCCVDWPGGIASMRSPLRPQYACRYVDLAWLRVRYTGGAELQPSKEAGTGKVRDPEMAELAEIIATINGMFSGAHPDSSVKSVVTHLHDRLLERDTLQQQVRANSLSQLGCFSIISRRENPSISTFSDFEMV